MTREEFDKLPSDVINALSGGHLEDDPDKLFESIKNETPDDLMYEVVAWHLGYPAWWGTIKQWAIALGVMEETAQ